jgi:hypothetical protein
VLIDDVSFTGATPKQGTTVSTTSVAYSVVGLRTLRRGLTSQLQLYSNTTPDTQFPTGYPTVLDNASLPLTGAPGGAGTTTYDRLTTLIDTQSQLLLSSLTTDDGHAFAGWDVSKNAVTSTDDVLDSYTAAIRGLLSAQLCSGQPNGPYLTRAVAVFNRMDSVFYSQAGLIYTATQGATSVAYTPMRFAVLEAALRELYELVGVRAADAALGKLLENRIARLIKLVLNGWDDLNANELVDYNTECITLGGVPGFGSGVIPVGRGGLQMAERALSGDLGFTCDSTNPDVCDAGGLPFGAITPDREKDCVPNIFAAQLPSALANQITFTIGN